MYWYKDSNLIALYSGSQRECLFPWFAVVATTKWVTQHLPGPCRTIDKIKEVMIKLFGQNALQGQAQLAWPKLKKCVWAGFQMGNLSWYWHELTPWISSHEGQLISTQIIFCKFSPLQLAFAFYLVWKSIFKREIEHNNMTWPISPKIDPLPLYDFLRYFT